MRSKSRFTTLVLLETRDPCAIALYASRPLSPGAHATFATKRALTLTRTGLPPAGSHQLAWRALIRSPRLRGRAAPKRWGCQAILCCRGARRGHEDAQHEQQVPFEGPPLH